MLLQYIIIGIIILICVGLAVYRIYRALTKPNPACSDCPLKGSCTRRNHKHKHFPNGCKPD